MTLRKRQAGVTLIEVLVSALVVAIGLVGVAGLQVASLKNNQSAFMRSQATALAYDLADRMRSNRDGAGSNQYDASAASLTTACASTTGCSAQQLAEHDMAEWAAALSSNLPMGTGIVCIDSTPDDGASAGSPACDGSGTQFAIKIWWDDNADGVINVSTTDCSSTVGSCVERLTINFQL